MMRHVENNAAFGRVGEDFFVNSATGLRKDQVARDFGRVLPVGSDGAVPYRALFTAVVEDQPKPGTVLLFGEIPIRKAVEELRGCGKRQAHRILLTRLAGARAALPKSLACSARSSPSVDGPVGAACALP
jgi:hypothetical protein